jgi:cytochrome c-type biogenesis protein CcmH
MMHVAAWRATALYLPQRPSSCAGCRAGREADEPQKFKGSARQRQLGAPLLRLFAIAVLALQMTCPAAAVEPGEIMKDPRLEARARHLSQELRCLVCQNQSIDDSSAELARDLRILVRERLAAGDSDAAVLAFVEARYGEFVLLRPRLALHTLLLWSTPLLLLGGAAFALVRRARERSWVKAGEEPQAQPLSPAERQRLDELIKRQQG